MGLFDRLMGRSAPPPPDLDRLFALPSAVLTLHAALGFAPTGLGSVAFRAPQGRAFAGVVSEAEQLLQAGGDLRVESTIDDFGYTWLMLKRDPGDTPGLVTDLHAINATLQDNGFGPTLLCSLVGFRGPEGQALGLVYLYKKGTFYPFAPRSDAPGQRDPMLELQVRDLLTGELTMEPSVESWFALWGAPGI